MRLATAIITSVLLAGCTNVTAATAVTFTEAEMDWVGKFGSLARCEKIFKLEGERRVSAKYNYLGGLVWDESGDAIMDKYGQADTVAVMEEWGASIDAAMTYEEQASYCYNEAASMGWI